MPSIETRVIELFGADAPAALEILQGPMRGVPANRVDDMRWKMIWLANGDIAALRALGLAANSDWRDIEGDYQAEKNLERFRKPPKRNWTL